jgi:hypothetical protein
VAVIWVGEPEPQAQQTNISVSVRLIQSTLTHYTRRRVLLFRYVLAQSMRRFGSAALDLAYVACGRFDGFFEFDPKACYVAAGALLVSEARGAISCIDGTPLNLFRGDVMAANRLIEPNLRKETAAFLADIGWKPAPSTDPAESLHRSPGAVSRPSSGTKFVSRRFGTKRYIFYTDPSNWFVRSRNTHRAFGSHLREAATAISRRRRRSELRKTGGHLNGSYQVRPLRPPEQ